DRRAAGLCRELAAHPTGRRVRELTGLALDPTFSAPKLAWLFARDPDLHARAAGGELAFGDVACWLAWHLGGGRHVTEPSNACRTLLVDLTTLTWDAALLDLFGVPAALLPEIRRSDDLDVRAGGHPAGVDAPVAAVLGDQPAALYGQGCTSPGMAALTLGTGAFLWSNVGPERPRPPQGVLATAAWHTDRFGPTYALEAFGANAGNALAILRSLGLIPKGWASAAPDWSRPHPVVVPAPAGLGTPRWDGADRITVLGASGTTSPEQLASACLAGVAHQIADALEAMEAQARPTGPLRVGGGLAADTALLQTVADLSGRSLEVAADLEATTRGIAALAATAVGLPGPEGPAEAAGRTIAPRLDGAGRARERERWHEAVDVHLATADGG
ncbi:MAG TPA: FGGY family carbohydrate kinase, partial [Gaiellales bacterium]|nr:FGGY family carbohydrate kinase [Gaiellales bacterium]